MEMAYLLEQELENLAPGKNFACMLTRVIVDSGDKAFEKPSYELGESYSKEEMEKLAAKNPEFKFKEVDGKWKRVVACPAPKDIVESRVIEQLVKNNIGVVCGGGGGIPVVASEDGTLHAVEGALDKDQSAALIAQKLNADVLLMLTDVAGIYDDWDTTRSSIVKTLTPKEIENFKFHEGGAMRGKAIAAAKFVSNCNGWVGVGSLDQINDILAGTAGTQIKGNPLKSPPTIIKTVPKDPNKWTESEICDWLREDLEFPDFAIDILTKEGLTSDGKKFFSLSASNLKKIGLNWGLQTQLAHEIRRTQMHNLLHTDKIFINAEPYPWPYNGELNPENTALMVIDMQHDFCGPGGYVEKMGYDLSLTRAPIAPIQNLLSFMRKHQFHIIHTREGHRPDLSDCPANKRFRSEKIGGGIGDPGPLGKILVRGERGWGIIPELAPLEDEVIIDKPGKGSFFATDIELILRARSIKNLLLTGVTTDVCVHTTMREANDRGFECLLLEDCTAAADPRNHSAAISMVKMSGGIFGATATSRAVLKTLSQHI
eukprot:CAMPEP_0174261314 /NCGR_PEP_ID=MMETSP0439-20130205/11357_1 /TAXON_ID=0 /ORGANISM="Stereomyxa ramosa, Strain Chinc5" /LENGTH=542 /DNA_ID=CAMNT_0015345769 /DNA_START=265 /DNA_END=1893 /DNA_ORIENTATION=-